MFGRSRIGSKLRITPSEVAQVEQYIRQRRADIIKEDLTSDRMLQSQHQGLCDGSLDSNDFSQSVAGYFASQAKTIDWWIPVGSELAKSQRYLSQCRLDPKIAGVFVEESDLPDIEQASHFTHGTRQLPGVSETHRQSIIDLEADEEVDEAINRTNEHRPLPKQAVAHKEVPRQSAVGQPNANGRAKDQLNRSNVKVRHVKKSSGGRFPQTSGRANPTLPIISGKQLAVDGLLGRTNSPKPFNDPTSYLQKGGPVMRRLSDFAAYSVSDPKLKPTPAGNNSMFLQTPPMSRETSAMQRAAHPDPAALHTGPPSSRVPLLNTPAGHSILDTEAQSEQCQEQLHALGHGMAHQQSREHRSAIGPGIAFSFKNILASSIIYSTQPS